jgi:arabinogalactan oligomer/maltooligosaccharide transport system substrate-binding protein
MGLKKVKKGRFFLVAISIISSVCVLALLTVSCDLFRGIVSEETVPIEVVDTSLEEEAQDEETEQKIEINIWENIEPKEQIALIESIDAFIAQNPDIIVNSTHMRSDEELLDQFIATSLAGAGPEIVISGIESGKVLAGANVIKEISGDLYYVDIFDGLREIASYEGREYVLPFRAYDLLLLYYNKDLITEVPSDFDELISYCKEVNNPGEDTWGFLLNSREPDWVIPFVGGYQDWIFEYDSNSITLDTPAMQKTMEFLLLLYNEEQIIPYEIEYADIDNAFIEGRAHMIINGNWALEKYANEGIDFGVAEIPVPVQGFKNPTPMVDGIGFMFNVNCFGKELEASQKFVDYMMSYDTQEDWTRVTQTLPVLSGIEQSPGVAEDQLFYNMVQQLKICRGKPPEEYIRVMRDAIRLNLENVILENTSPEDAVSKMQEDAIKLKTGNLEVQDEDAGTETSAEEQ